MTLSTGAALLQIIWINILLSGDNAVVIALACRSLSKRERRIGIVFGAAAAVVLRIAFTVGLTEVLEIPYARAVAALLLLWIAVRLLTEDGDDEGNVKSHDTLWRAIITIMIADIVMSLDNIVAIAAAAHGNIPLIAVGLALSIPIVVVGSTLIVDAIRRFPILVWAGSALLGWVAGDLYSEDVRAMAFVPAVIDHWVLAGIGALLVLLVGWAIRSRRKPAGAPTE